MVTWTTDLDAAVLAQAAGQALVMLARGERVKEYATVPFGEVRELVAGCPDVVFYEVVTEGKCYLHLCAHNADRYADPEAMYDEVKAALTEALPDIPIAGMRPERSTGVVDGRAILDLVYKDVGVKSLAAARAIGEAVAEKLGPSATEIDLDVYRHCYCHRLPTCRT